MKRALLAAILSCLALAPARADLIWYESFNYANGPINQTGTNSDGSTNWFRQSGSGNDAFVRNHRLEVSATGSTNTSRSDDVNRKFAVTAGSPYTNSPMVVYASFTLNCTNLPTAQSNYFAHFLYSDTGFYGKLFALQGSLPGTWRLGISGAANAVNQIFPADLAPNTDYQVVIGWDPVNLYSATLWVDPLSSGDTSVATSDAITSPKPVVGFGFRQASSFGSAFFNVTNLAVATTFEEAANAVWSATPAAPVVAAQPKSVTNFVGNSATLSIVAAGQGLTSLNYQWRKNGADISNPNGNANTLPFYSLSSADAGQYTVVVSNPTTGLSTTSAVAFVVINVQPVPPTITQQPTNTTVYFGQTATLYVDASGAAPISYQWFYNNSAIGGATDSSLSIANVQNNNGTTGTYRCDVTNPNGTTKSANASISAIAAPAVKIGYLRTLVDPVFFLPTNTTALYTVTGIVTTYTNVTTAANSSFYIQDDTGGIDVFFGGNPSVWPQAGDKVTVTGPLGHYNSLLELNLSASDPAHSVITNSSNNPLPAGVVLPFSFTNSAAFGGVSNALRLYQGAVVTFTNVYFPDGFAGDKVFAGGQNYTITNQAGETFAFRVDARVGDIIGQPIPPFAWTVTAPMSFFLSGTATDRSAGYQLMPTRYADIVTNAPAPVTGSVASAGGKPTISWLAQPYMSYSILRASNVSGPYSALASGMTFNSTAGQYTDTNAVPATRFYKIVSP